MPSLTDTDHFSPATDHLHLEFFQIELLQDLSLMFFESLISHPDEDSDPKLEAISGLVKESGVKFSPQVQMVNIAIRYS